VVVDEEEAHGERRRRVDVVEAQHGRPRVQLACAAAGARRGCRVLYAGTLSRTGALAEYTSRCAARAPPALPSTYLLRHDHAHAHHVDQQCMLLEHAEGLTPLSNPRRLRATMESALRPRARAAHTRASSRTPRRRRSTPAAQRASEQRARARRGGAGRTVRRLQHRARRRRHVVEEFVDAMHAAEPAVPEARQLLLHRLPAPRADRARRLAAGQAALSCSAARARAVQPVQRGTRSRQPPPPPPERSWRQPSSAAPSQPRCGHAAGRGACCASRAGAAQPGPPHARHGARSADARLTRLFTPSAPTSRSYGSSTARPSGPANVATWRARSTPCAPARGSEAQQDTPVLAPHPTGGAQVVRALCGHCHPRSLRAAAAAPPRRTRMRSAGLSGGCGGSRCAGQRWRVCACVGGVTRG